MRCTFLINCTRFRMNGEISYVNDQKAIEKKAHSSRKDTIRVHVQAPLVKVLSIKSSYY